LTAPHIPTFILLLILTPLTVFLLALPLLPSLARKALLAYRLSHTDPVVKGWYDWWPSWIIAGGPVGRYAGGVILSWKELDRRDGRSVLRLEVGVIAGIGLILGLIAAVRPSLPLGSGNGFP
jgi:palmitoyltransferase